MFDDLLLDLGGAFAAAASAGKSRADCWQPRVSGGDLAGPESVSNMAEGGVSPTATNGTTPRETSKEFSAEHCDGKGGDGGRKAGGSVRGVASAPVFHVTEYDVTKGQYPESWEDYAGALSLLAL